MWNLVRLAWRACRISSSIFRFLVIPNLTSRNRRAPQPEQVRRALEELGGVWIKVGQALALRFDLLPPEYCTEFLKLLNAAAPFPCDDVRKIIKQELGGFPEEVFASFESVPFAAASIAQVHRAVAFDGQKLAVKVQRPDIQQLFLTDLRIMRAFAWVLDLVRALGDTSLRAFVDEFARWTNEEVNFRQEARNANRMRLFAKNDPYQVNAKVRFDLTSERVLTTAFIDGISLLDIITAIHRSDEVYLNDLAEQGYDLDKIAQRICWNMLNQMFRDGFFHADLHPANLFVLPGNVIAYIDFGIAGRLSEELQLSLRHYVRNLFRANFDAAIAELLRWNTPSVSTDLDSVRRDLILVLEDYRYGLGSSEAGGPLQLTSGFLANMMGVMRRHRLTMSESLILYFKALLTTDAVIFELSPRYDLFATLNQFFLNEFKLDAKAAMEPRMIFESALTFGHQSAQFLSDINRIQSTGRLLEVSLETAQTRFAFYAIWAAILGAAAYVVHDDSLFGMLQEFLGLGRHWFSAGLLVAVVVFVVVVLRQGRNIAAVDRRAVTRREAYDRPLGRQR